MLRILCAAIPVLVIILNLTFDDPILWLLSLLFAMLGLIFAIVNFRFMKDKPGIILLVVNIAVFIYSVINTVMEFV